MVCDKYIAVVMIYQFGYYYYHYNYIIAAGTLTHKV